MSALEVLARAVQYALEQFASDPLLMFEEASVRTCIRRGVLNSGGSLLRSTPTSIEVLTETSGKLELDLCGFGGEQPEDTAGLFSRLRKSADLCVLSDFKVKKNELTHVLNRSPGAPTLQDQELMASEYTKFGKYISSSDCLPVELKAYTKRYYFRQMQANAIKKDLKAVSGHSLPVSVIFFDSREVYSPRGKPRRTPGVFMSEFKNLCSNLEAKEVNSMQNPRDYTSWLWSGDVPIDINVIKIKLENSDTEALVSFKN